ncbi:hypothetical protein NNO_0272 [Hydrogenimonas sp.]|nr:hypothetical protein NNO_0272 [Hydrogenimonas sp.]
MGKLGRYFWPKTALLFYVMEETIFSAFGYIEDGKFDIQQRREFEVSKSSGFVGWFEEIRETYPKTYLCAMLDTSNQGAVPGCSKSALEKYGIDAALVHTHCIGGSWMVYTSLVEMKWFEQRFKGVEFDLLYSPFVLLYRKCMPMLDEKPALFLLHQKGFAFLAIFSAGKLWYAQVLVIGGAEEGESGTGGADEGEPADLAFDLELIDEEVESISDVDLLGDFSEELGEKSEEDESAFELLEYNLNLFEEIKSALSRFYRDERYSHDFIERVVIFDMDDLGSDLVRYIEDELFMKASLHTFDPIEVMAEIVAEDLES